MFPEAYFSTIFLLLPIILWNRALNIHIEREHQLETLRIPYSFEATMFIKVPKI